MSALNAAELLVTARSLLLGELLPSLPEGLRYECRMIASALAIATRETELREEITDFEEVVLMQLLGEQSCAGMTREGALASAAQSIRRGWFDRPGVEQDRLLQALTKITRARLRISNPRVLGNAH